MPNSVELQAKVYICSCGAKAKNTSKERGRFLRRHPKLCLASGKVPPTDAIAFKEGATGL